MNRRAFLTLGLKSAVLAVAVSTGLGRISLEIAPRAMTLDELLSEVLRKHRAQIVANVEANNALFSRLVEAGGYSGPLGEAISEPIQYGSNVLPCKPGDKLEPYYEMDVALIPVRQSGAAASFTPSPS
jgi:hypothetical protein